MKKIYLLPAAFLLSSSILSYSIVAKADDDHEEKGYYNNYEENRYEEHDDHDEYENYHDDDEDYEEYEENEDYYYNDQQQQINVVKESWFKWSRSAVDPNEIAPLPISQAAEVSLKLNNEEPIKIEAIPDGSQLLVPVEEVGKYLGAKTIIYPKSEIVEISKDNLQLIVRNNTKVVYEDMKKTPMQAQVIKKNDQYYMPISVLANGLGYQILETTTNNQIDIKGVVQL